MTAPHPPRATPAPGLIAAFARADWFRLGPEGATEWVHFIVTAPGLSVLVNLSLETRGPSPSPRLLLLAYTDRWHGEVEAYPPGEVDLRQGRVDAAFGPNVVRLRPDGYHVRAALRDGSVRVELVFHPVAMPLLALRLPLGLAGDLSWLAAPRLIARGTVDVAGPRHVIEGAPAYHDHNWGRFDWGRASGGSGRWSSLRTPHPPGPCWSSGSPIVRVVSCTRRGSGCGGRGGWCGAGGVPP